MTPEQKLFDFQSLGSLYAKRYAPYEWKKTLFNYDLLDLSPWLERIRRTDNDLDFLETLIEYVAKANDSHSQYRITSSFSASLGFAVDVYYDENDKNPVVLIDSVSRSALPAGIYPFDAGDELVSIDGVKALDQAQKFLKNVNSANPRSVLRTAVSYLPSRSQSVIPRAHELGDSAIIEVKRQSSGAIESYTIPWRKSGLPLTTIGQVPSPKMSVAQPRTTEEEAPAYLRTILQFRNERDESPAEIAGYGSLTPVWDRPADFSQRLGRSLGDEYFTGTMTANGHKVGYLRIPSFGPLSISTALRQLETEIRYFQDNTEGLVVDVMRNPGGDPCYAEQVFARLTPAPWRALGRQLRVIWSDVLGFQNNLDLARALRAPQAIIDLLQARLDDALSAYQSNRGMTPPVGVCDAGLDRDPAATNYSKPILLLADEFSASAADGFSAIFQDNQRGKIFGWRTNGAGGAVVNYPSGAYSEFGTARVTVSLQCRRDPIQAVDYPSTNYVENVGVQPDAWVNYMRVLTMRQKGKPFVDGFLQAMAAVIENQ